MKKICKIILWLTAIAMITIIVIKAYDFTLSVLFDKKELFYINLHKQNIELRLEHFASNATTNSTIKVWLKKDNKEELVAIQERLDYIHSFDRINDSTVLFVFEYFKASSNWKDSVYIELY